MPLVGAALLAALLLLLGLSGTGWPGPAPLGDEVADLCWPWPGFGFAVSPTLARVLAATAVVATLAASSVVLRTARFAGPLTVLLVASHPALLHGLLSPSFFPIAACGLLAALAANALAVGRRSATAVLLGVLLVLAGGRPEALAFLAWPALVAGSRDRVRPLGLFVLAAMLGGGLMLFDGSATMARLEALLAPGAELDAGEPWRKRMVGLMPLLLLLACARLPSVRMTALAAVALVASVVATPGRPGPALTAVGPLFASVGLLGVLLGRLAAGRRPGIGPAVVVAAAILVLLLGRHTTMRLAWRAQEPVRRETSRAIEALEALGPVSPEENRLVLGLPPERDGFPGPGHLVARGADPSLRPLATVAGGITSVFEWAAPPSPGRIDPEAFSLELRLRARQDDGGALQLLEPADGAVLSCRVPEDEPQFVFAVARDRDPGPMGFSFHALAKGEGERWISRRLDPSVLERRRDGERVLYIWQPSWRSRAGAVRELRWEREELAPRGGWLDWTITLRRSPRELPLMAAPFRVVARP